MISNFLRAACAIFLAAALCGSAFAQSGFPPLHQAAGDGDVAAVKRLIDGGADVNAQLKDGFAPLHVAAGAGHIGIAVALIKAGADINIKAKNGLVPLHVAAVYGQTDVAIVLAKAGADINAKENDGETHSRTMRRREISRMQRAENC